jgi:mannose-1-phosphate guanylyltransferase
VIYGVILAGGRGERFWPLSRIDKPKQFLKLTSDKTMLEETILRVRPLIPLEAIRIVSSESMSDQILASASYLSEKHIISEPFGRNTCLAIGLAAIHLAKEDPNAVMAVLSADHLIRPPEKLLKILEDGCAIAQTEQQLITIGIPPTRPDTAYGYIKLGDEMRTRHESVVYKVSAFAEKPKAVVAQEYYYSRRYLWNSGMFIWTAQAILKAISQCQPEMGKLLEEYGKSIGTPAELEARRHLYEKATSISIDYAVLENTAEVLVIRADIVWDDIGSWTALERYKELDGENNVLVGETLPLDTFETTIYNNADGLIATLGVSDLVIVRSDNITLVAHKTRLDQIKVLLTRLKENASTQKYL